MSCSISIEEWKHLAHEANYRVSAFAKKFGCSVRQIERFVATRTAQSPKAWLNEVRLTESLVHLAADKSVKEVAHFFGYKQVSHFSRDFKRFHRFSPAQVKKEFNSPIVAFR
jgi:AraC-like DNA-binding protein